MTYHATTQRTIVLFFFMFAIGWLVTSREYPQLYYVLIPYVIFLFAALFTRFTFKVGDSSLTFTIRIVTLTVYKREVPYDQIIGMKFGRAGWGKKCVIVRNSKGFNFRIIHFQPEDIYHDLIEFANNHEIPVSKTKDYLILEKD